MDEFISAQQLADMLGVDRETVYLWTSQDRIPSYRIPLGGRHRRFRRSEVEAWLASCKEGPRVRPLRLVQQDG